MFCCQHRSTSHTVSLALRNKWMNCFSDAYTYVCDMSQHRDPCAPPTVVSVTFVYTGRISVSLWAVAVFSSVSHLFPVILPEHRIPISTFAPANRSTLRPPGGTHGDRRTAVSGASSLLPSSGFHWSHSILSFSTVITFTHWAISPALTLYFLKVTYII